MDELLVGLDVHIFSVVLYFFFSCDSLFYVPLLIKLLRGIFWSVKTPGFENFSVNIISRLLGTKNFCDLCQHNTYFCDLFLFINAGKHNLPLLFTLAPSRLALGVEDRRIPDGGFSASSSWDRNHGAKRARLNIVRRGRRIGAWSSRVKNRAQWLLIDITKMARVVGFAIQGRQDANQWVMSLRISYSRDGIRFRYYTERKRPKVC